MSRSRNAKEAKLSGQPEVLSSPFIFSWTVNEAGYEWGEEKAGKVGLIPRYVPGAGGLWQYVPEPGLFREFVKVNLTRDSIGHFADKYGDILERWDIPQTQAQSGRSVAGTLLETWKAAIHDMHVLVDMWDQVQDESRHAELNKLIVRTQKEICYVRGLTYVTLARDHALSRFGAKDVVLPARCALQWEINKRLTDTETPTLVPTQLTWASNRRQRIAFEPGTLLAEMWMRFAQVVAEELRLKRCVVCCKYFQVGPGGKRRHSETCSDNCRRRKSRNPAKFD